ncbi:hypothetical protein, partial [Burkholderia ubonensis]|uniref:hypothetical protein n=1 Tax=Burkholderia ubonensis TaxID=101571 RepID=UPI001E39396F
AWLQNRCAVGSLTSSARRNELFRVDLIVVRLMGKKMAQHYPAEFRATQFNVCIAVYFRRSIGTLFIGGRTVV